MLAGKRPPIFWGWPAHWRRAEIASATSPLARSNAVHAASRASHIDLPQALETVAAAYALPELVRELPAGAYFVDLKTPGALPVIISAFVLLTAAVVASMLPAARAARVDVIQALRSE